MKDIKKLSECAYRINSKTDEIVRSEKRDIRIIRDFVSLGIYLSENSQLKVNRLIIELQESERDHKLRKLRLELKELERDFINAVQND